MQGDRIPDAELEVFFAAARRVPPADPDIGLMNRILADAADVTAARRETLPPTPRAADRTGIFARLRGVFAPLGGLPTAAALGFCAALGLTAGLLGGADASSAVLWEVVETDDEPLAAVLAFYELEIPEG